MDNPPKLQESLNLLPLIGWASLDNEDPAVHQFVRRKLVEAGVRPEHWRVLKRLHIYCNAQIASGLADADKRPVVLNALELLSSLTADQFGNGISDVGLINLMKALQYVPRERLRERGFINLFKAWATQGEGDSRLLILIVQWWLHQPGGDVGRSWEKIRSRFCLAQCWQIPYAIPKREGSVIIDPLLSGEAVLEEGKRMGNCIASNFDEYVHDALRGRKYLFHLREEKQPLICATLTVRRFFTDERWQPSEFETVGHGIPSKFFHDAANVVVAALNNGTNESQKINTRSR